MVPELLAKKRKRDEQAATARAAAAVEARKKARTTRKDIFKRAEKYVAEYRSQEKDQVRLKREAKAKGGFYVPAEAKVLFVVRIRGLNKIAPKTKKILQLLRLKQQNMGVFLKVSKPVLNMLQRVEPYVAFGYPNLKSVRELVYKRGYAKVKGNPLAKADRIPLTDNRIIEEHLGKHGLICMEDLVHELYTCGPKFKEVSTFLWPFKLSAPKGGMDRKRLHYVEGGQAGNREDKINAFIRKMN
ncbi:hypothetical protein HYH03_016188 [Edaphochlamys debaryana]|uniref:60S ribosomal protein L7 n=1 Tax=Edaphochlamys debaryana TaxID=47281 RepID=A0A835XMT8_9CHLO|nr:hypothetical protein HYH03_016188 [Edaphochlamys debaryana]|eukprot:KAG2485091.1 hypothetical protein HYH03_016188 [Edaphochlamys debaryana]